MDISQLIAGSLLQVPALSLLAFGRPAAARAAAATADFQADVQPTNAAQARLGGMVLVPVGGLIASYAFGPAPPGTVFPSPLRWLTLAAGAALCCYGVFRVVRPADHGPARQFWRNFGEVVRRKPAIAVGLAALCSGVGVLLIAGGVLGG